MQGDGILDEQKVYISKERFVQGPGNSFRAYKIVNVRFTLVY